MPAENWAEEVRRGGGVAWVLEFPTKQVTDRIFGTDSSKGRLLDAKASVEPAVAPDLAFASPPSKPASAIVGVG